MNLANKYRPKYWKDLVEQDAVKQILEYQLQSKQFSNAYLFTGSAGTGKTTSARIFANEINNWKGEPIEMDAASNNGVDDVRKIIDGSKFKSISGGEYKCYIIDECHQLTQAAWAAMLKLLEEPPSKSIFLLCTTDPQKIPDTILSRVLRFDFQKITHSSVVNRLNYILQQEQASEDGLNVQGWDQEALSYIAKIANGGMRDAITMLDKCLNYSNNLTVEAVVKALGVTNYDQMFSILNGFVNKNEAQLMSNIENLYSSGTDLKQFIKSFIQFVLDLCKFDLFQDFQYVQIPPSFQSTLMQYSKENYIYFRKLLEMLINVNYKIKWETNPKMLIQTEFLLEMLK